MTAIDAFHADAWTKQHSRLPDDLAALAPRWHRDYASRQVLVEIDILPGKVLNLILDGLQTKHRVQFSFLRQYESETYHNATHRVVFTPSKGLPGVGVHLKTIKSDICAYRSAEDIGK